MHRHGRSCSLFSTELQSSKLLVASSILVSRSIFSTADKTAIATAVHSLLSGLAISRREIE
jgi:hypothetical protein